MKKFRGKKRYFRNLKNETVFETHNLDFSDDSWFDFWHTHLDFYGRGNESIRYRKLHLQASYDLMMKLNARLHEWDQPFQIWMEISQHDAALDAVYVHSFNPNETPFPFEHKALQPFQETLPDYLTGWFNADAFMVSYYVEEQEWDEADDDDNQSVHEVGALYDKKIVIQPKDNHMYALKSNIH